MEKDLDVTESSIELNVEGEPVAGAARVGDEQASTSASSNSTKTRQSNYSTATSTSSINTEDPADGEIFQLLQSTEEESAPLALSSRVELELHRQLSKQDLLESPPEAKAYKSLTETACYGHPLSVKEATELMPPGDEGITHHATIVPNEFFVKGKLRDGLNPRDFDKANKKIKPRRPSLIVTARDFFSSLTKIDGPAKGQKRYIFHGVLNGWPALRTLELVNLEQRRHSSALPPPIEIFSGNMLWKKTWDAKEDGMRGVDPKIHGSDRIYRVKLRGAPWTASGWSKDSPGFCFWFESQRSPSPRLTYGTNMSKEIATEDAKCTNLHLLSHRYATKKETPKDRLTYHSVVMLEWDHGQYCSLIEAAYLNGVGGYKGKSNWFHDRDENFTQLYKALPPEMVAPWKTTSAEIRCYDVPIKCFADFRHYVAIYEGSNKRFLDPHFTFSHAARLTFRSKSQIAKYLANYISRGSAYGELTRNCQTFAADFVSFLAGKRGIEPFHPVNRIDYQNRTYLFLYEPAMYDTKKKSDKKKRPLRK